MAEENTTILILKGVKRVRSIKINRRRIRLAIYAVSVFSILLVFSIGLNIYQFTNPGFLDNITENLPLDNNSTLTQAASNDQETSDENFSSPEKSEVGSNGENGLNLEDTEVVEEKEDIFSGDIDSETIGLENWVHNFSPDKRELEVSFQMYVKDNSNNTVSGTIIILAKTNDANNPFISSKPEIRISTDGTIPNYYRGENFSMSIRTPEKTGRLVLPGNSTSFEYYRILVYSRDGDILLQQTRSLSNSF